MRRLRLRPVQFGVLLEELGFAARSRATKPVRHLPHDLLHHREVLEVVVGLEEGHPGVELNQDAAQRERITRI